MKIKLESRDYDNLAIPSYGIYSQFSSEVIDLGV